MAIENTVSIYFDPRSSIFKSVFDCCLSGVYLLGPLYFILGSIFSRLYLERLFLVKSEKIKRDKTTIYFRH